MSKIQVECPNCKQEILNAYITSNRQFEQLGVKKRTVYGHCLHCDNNFEIVQFLKDAIEGAMWLTTRYRRYVLRPQAWQHVADVPVPPVMLGNADDRFEELVGSEK